MWRLLALSAVQSLMLSFGQMTLKLALGRLPRFEWTAAFWGNLLTNWWFLACGLLFGGASLLWMYILKHFPLSQAYPMASMSFVFGIVIAAVFLHEDVSWNRWFGVAMIMAGCVFVAR